MHNGTHCATKGRESPALFHPAALLLAVISLMIALQFLAPLLLGLALCLLLLIPGTRPLWQRLMWRNRWLLLTLLVVFAYGLPGDGLGGIEWLPSQRGLLEALMQGLRLVTLLAALSCLLCRCKHAALMSGLWALLNPLRHLGIPVEASIVRLSLVLSHLESQPPQRGLGPARPRTTLMAWQNELLASLAPPATTQRDTETLHLHLRPWQRADSALVLAAATLLVSLLA